MSRRGLFAFAFVGVVDISCDSLRIRKGLGSDWCYNDTHAGNMKLDLKQASKIGEYLVYPYIFRYVV